MTRSIRRPGAAVNADLRLLSGRNSEVIGMCAATALILQGMMIKTLSLAAAFLASAVSAEAAEQPVVLELFVSQGCSSCPPANALMRDLSAERDDLLILTYGVTYWDYLGWKDTFGNPAFTERQRDYAKAFKSKRVYTPQLVADGMLEGIGSRRGDVGGFIKACKAQNRTGPEISAEVADDMVSVTVKAAAAPEGGADVWLVRYQPGEVSVDVSRGENAGRTYTAVNPVTGIERLGEWTGGTETFSVADDGNGAAVLVQTRGLGPVLGAGRLP